MTGPIIRSLAAGLVVLTVLATAPLSAQKPTDGTGRTVSEKIITELERQIIERYVLERRGSYDEDHDGKGKKGKVGKKKGKSGELPPGLAKRRELPPGLAKRQTLPPGLAKRELPLDLRRRLPRRYHADLYNIDGNAVLIQRGTELVLDIIEGIFAEN